MRIAAFIILFPIMLVLAGCLGAESHDVTTDGFGSFAGLMIIPEPQSLSISLNDDFYLDWRVGYSPPSEFTIALQSVDVNGDVSPIFTELETLRTGHYILRPVMSLPEQTFLILRLTSHYDEVRAMYLTEEDYYFVRPKEAGSEGAAEHTVKTP